MKFNKILILTVLIEMVSIAHTMDNINNTSRPNYIDKSILSKQIKQNMNTMPL